MDLNCTSTAEVLAGDLRACLVRMLSSNTLVTEVPLTFACCCCCSYRLSRSDKAAGGAKQKTFGMSLQGEHTGR